MSICLSNHTTINQTLFFGYFRVFTSNVNRPLTTMTIPHGPPIDTTDRAYCDNCENSIRKKGDYYHKHKKSRSYSRQRSHKYMNVCPYCNENSPTYFNVDIFKCPDCRGYFTDMDIPSYPRDTTKECPHNGCNHEITKDSITKITD